MYNEVAAKQYDYIIIGAGPTGLTLATYLPGSILVIDKFAEIGGCHRVIRIGGRLTEHGPRVYSGAYRNFMSVLSTIGTTFEEEFVKYDFSVSNIAGKGLPFTIREWVILASHFLLPGHGSIGGITSSFSEGSKDYINRLCLLTDGAGSDRYPTHKFMNLLNQQLFYDLYQPKMATDRSLFKKWKTFLDKRGVIFKADTISKIDNKILTGSKGTYQGTKIILTIPLIQAEKLLYRREISIGTDYQKYYSIMFWWKESFKFPKVWGFPKSDWGVAFIPLTNYMTGEEGTYLSTCITLPSSKSRLTGKTAFELTESDLIEEVYNQLKESFPGLKRPDWTHLSETGDTAFINVHDTKTGPKTEFEGIYTVGTHNGMNKYDFTSLESAVENALAFLDIEKVAHPRETYGWDLTDLIILVLGSLLISLLI